MRTIGDRYELRGVIASGGMATVHLARQKGAAGFARMVAVKQLHERFARAPEFVTMFLDEARLVARIRHVNVVQTLDVVHDRESSELFIVMEYVHGVSLHQVMQTARARFLPIRPAIASAIMVGALHGLHEAHEARGETGEPLGIVHRDVSPHNILVGVDGAPRVLDFGVAKAQERISSTHEGELKGKLSYMSTEQISNVEVDRRTDVYASAVVMWELLSGRKLFGAGNEASVLKQVLEAPVSPPSTHQPVISLELDRTVMRGLARDAKLRWPTARDFAVAISACTTPASAGEVSVWLRELCASIISERDTAIATIEAKSSHRNMLELQDSLRSMGLMSNASEIAAKAVGQAQALMDLPRITPEPTTQTAPSGPPSGTLSRPSGIPSGRVSARGTLVLPDSESTIPVAPPMTPSRPLATGPPAEVTSTRVASSISTPIQPPKRSGAAVGLAIGGVVLLATAGASVTLIMRQSSKRHANAPPVAISASASAPRVSLPPPSATCPDGMVRVQGGKFFMGADDGPAAQRPAHHAKIHALCIDRFEVSANAYRACSDRGDCKRAPDTNRFEGMGEMDHKVYDPLCTGPDPARSAHPINCIDWSMASRYCTVHDKRLPTEAEWEFAARGSDGRMFPWGDATPTPKLLNACGRECELWFKKNGQPSPGGIHRFDDGWPTTAPTGSFAAGASPFGAEDMAGNVWEWVADWFGPYPREDVSDPAGPEAGTTRVIRGGAWNGSSPEWVRSTFRFHVNPEARSYGTGFRCAKTLP